MSPGPASMPDAVLPRASPLELPLCSTAPSTAESIVNFDLAGSAAAADRDLRPHHARSQVSSHPCSARHGHLPGGYRDLVNVRRRARAQCGAHAVAAGVDDADRVAVVVVLLVRDEPDRVGAPLEDDR